MKTILLLLFSLNLYTLDYSRLRIHQVLDQSEIIIQGKIVGIDSNYIEVLIEEQLIGSTYHNTILIEKFKNWSCFHRWEEYLPNQRSIFCLIPGKETKTWRVTGAGNEGELPIYKDRGHFILNNGPTYSTLPNSPSFSFELKEMKAGIVNYINNRRIIQKMIESKSIPNYKTSNFLLEKIKIEKMLFNKKYLGLNETEVWDLYRCYLEL